MACNKIKCSNSTCNNEGKACTFVNGKCPNCYEKEREKQVNIPEHDVLHSPNTH